MSGATASFDDRAGQIDNLRRYYKFHALIYDATRWSFLFGRTAILKKLPSEAELLQRTGSKQLRILEVGCGTGKNLAYLAAKYPHAHLTGIDVSADMIQKSAKKLQAHADRLNLLEEPYEKGGNAGGDFDLVLFSYSLSMINPQWSEILDTAREDLKPGGLAAAVDFSDTAFGWFRKHMAGNHVRVDGHLLPGLRERFAPILNFEGSAYLGIWKYLMFIGEKK